MKSLTNFSNSLQLLADKDTVKYLLEKMNSIDKIMEDFATKKYLKEES